MLEVKSNGQFALQCCKKNSQNNVCIIVHATADSVLCRLIAKLAKSALRRAGKHLCKQARLLLMNLRQLLFFLPGVSFSRNEGINSGC